MKPTCVAGLLVFAVLLGACRAGSDDGTPLPDLTAFDEGIAAQVDQIAAQTSYMRGLPPAEDIDQGTLSREQMTEYNEQSAIEAREESGDEFAAFNTAFRLLHMIGPEDDLLDILMSYQSDLVLGFYSFDDDKLVLVSDAPRLLSHREQSTLSHEYVHAMQDAEFDLDELHEMADDEADDKANTEYADTLDALIEGDANFTEARYVASRPPDSAPAAPPASLADAQDTLAEIPPAIRRYLSFSYVYGEDFVTDLFEHGGWDAINAAFEDPPLSEEQIIHPEKYRDREKPKDLRLKDISDDLDGHWEQQDDSVFGEFDVYNWLYSTLNDGRAASLAAIGWGGGRMASYWRPEDGRVLLHMVLSWDTREDAIEFFSMFMGYVGTLDSKPTIVDPDSYQVIGWDAPLEAGRAWIDLTTFQLMVTLSPDDLAAALEAVEAPDKISRSGYLLP
jgi:hypothetical protein